MKGEFASGASWSSANGPHIFCRCRARTTVFTAPTRFLLWLAVGAQSLSSRIHWPSNDCRTAPRQKADDLLEYRLLRHGRRCSSLSLHNDDTSRATLCTDYSPMFQRVRSKNYKMCGSSVSTLSWRAHQIPQDFGILSIDARGMDYEVLLGLDLKRWQSAIDCHRRLQTQGRKKICPLS